MDFWPQALLTQICKSPYVVLGTAAFMQREMKYIKTSMLDLNTLFGIYLTKCDYDF